MLFLPRHLPIKSAAGFPPSNGNSYASCVKASALASTLLMGLVLSVPNAMAQSASDEAFGQDNTDDPLFTSPSSNLLRGAADGGETGISSLPTEPFVNQRVEPVQPLQQGRSSQSSGDAYEPLGLQIGSFDLLPSIGFYGELTDNFSNSSNKTDGTIGRVELEADLRSNWSRHRFAVDAQAGVDGYAEPNRRPQYDANIDAELRLDLQDRTSVTIAGGYAYEREAEDNAELRASGLEASNQTTLTGRAQIDHDTGLIFAQLRGSVTDESYSNDRSRDNHTFGVGGRFGYHLTDQVAPFVDLAASRKKYDVGVNRQNGDNIRASVGVEVSNRAKLSGEVSVGYMIWKPNAPCCNDDGVFFADASLTWSPDPLWTITGGFDTSLSSSSTNATSLLTHTASLDVDYAMRRNLTLSANASLAREDYRGLGRKDWITNAGFGAEYRVNRNMQLIGRVRHERRDSSVGSENFQTNRVEVGVKFLK